MQPSKTHACLSIIACVFLYGTIEVAAEEKKTGETQKAESNKGLTLEELGRGLKSAEQNIEKEIPKIGSAIGGAFKKITEKEPDKLSSEASSPKKK